MANKNCDAKINVEFTEVTSRQSLNSGDEIKTLFGKIKKWFSDIKAVAFSGSYNDLSDCPVSLPADGGNSETVNGLTVLTAVPANAKFTDTTYSLATTSANGLMSASDKTKLGYSNIAYCTCSTAAATAAKVVTVSGNSNWALTVGSVIVVKFTVTNTASSCTLNVNGTGAKQVWYNHAVNTSSSTTIFGYANRNITYIYDGTYWQYVGCGYLWSLAAASTTANGYVSTGAQSFAGNKTFNGTVQTSSGYDMLCGRNVAIGNNQGYYAANTSNIQNCLLGIDASNNLCYGYYATAVGSQHFGTRTIPTCLRGSRIYRVETGSSTVSEIRNIRTVNATTYAALTTSNTSVNEIIFTY